MQELWCSTRAFLCCQHESCSGLSVEASFIKSHSMTANLHIDVGFLGVLCTLTLLGWTTL